MSKVKQLHQAELVVGLEFDIELECLTTRTLSPIP